MTLNMLNVAKICRICLAEGARNIFDRTNCSTTHSGGHGGVECVASLENLLEKMRYVTMAQIKESDMLPKLICDNCIVQLNVSYNFKRKALENDLKLRQYIIEKGLETTIDENTNGAPALYYTSNISIVHKNSENVDHHFNPPSLSETNPTITNTVEPAANVAVIEKDVLPNQLTSSNHRAIPIKVELADSPATNECNSRFIPELNLPNPNLMVIVNDNNALLTQSIPSSNSISAIPSPGSSSFTNENNIRDSEFLRNYVSNKINFDVTTNEKRTQPVKIDRRFKTEKKFLQTEKFLRKHLQRNLNNTTGMDSSTPDKLKVSNDLKSLILDQKENFASALKMRHHNKKLFYSLRRNQQKPVKQIRPKKEVKRLKKVGDLDNQVN